MRNTTLIALFSTAAATVTVAPTLALDCKTKNAKCTADLCWDAKKFNVEAAYKLGCADFDTAADKCQYGDATSCNNTVCAGKTWANCKTCNDTPQDATCWTATDKAASCQWTDKDCTADICKGHESVDSETVKPAAGKTALWGDYYWSQSCTYAKMQTLKLKDVKNTAEWKTLDTADKAALTKSAATEKTDCPTLAHGAKESAACVTADKAWKAQKSIASTNSAYATKNEDAWKTEDLKECKAKDTDAACNALKSTNDAALAKAQKAEKTAKTAVTTSTAATKTAEGAVAKATLATKTATTAEATCKTTNKSKSEADIKKACKVESEAVTSKTAAEVKAKSGESSAIANAKKTEAADKVTAKAATAKTAQVQAWVTAVDDALTNNWGVTDQKWLTTWQEETFKSAKTLAEVKVLQAAADKAHSDASTAETAANTKMTNDEATVVTDKALWTSATEANKAKTLATLNTSKTAHTAAVTAHDTAVKKTAFLLKWKTWADDYTTNDWSDNDTDKRFEIWMVNAMKDSDTKVDAQVFQTKNVNDLAAAKKANDDTKSDANGAKVAELEKWVAEGNKILTNSWNKAGYTQDWQFTWWKNKCIALKTKDDMMKEHVQNTVDLSDTEKKLAAATKLQASTLNEVNAAKARVSTKDTKMEALRADRDTSAAKLENYNSAVNAYDIAVAHKKAQTDALDAATADVKEWTAKQTELKAWLAWGEARITNTYQAHQIIWMKNKIAEMKYEYSAIAIQTANEKALAAHKAAKATATGDALDTLKDQIAQETSWVKEGKAALADPANLNAWQGNALTHTTTVKTATALVAKLKTACPVDTVVSNECTWVKNAKAHLTKLTAEKTARDAVNTKAAAKVVLADKKAVGTTKAEARAELARLRADAQEAGHHLAQTKEAVTDGACSTDNADTIECEDLVRKQDLQEAQLAAAKAAVTKQTTYLNTNAFPESDDAAIAIIILCVSAFICIAGGFFFHWWGKKQLKKEQENAQRVLDDPQSTPEQITKAQKVLINVKLEQGEAVEAKEGDMEGGVDAKPTGLNFYGADADDRFTAMVDAEY